MNRTYQSGFTLIELLVVISITSLLASTILVSLGAARVKAKNARIVQEALQLRNTFETGWTGTYYGDFTSISSPMQTWVYVATNSFSNTNITKEIADIISLNGEPYGGGVSGLTDNVNCGGGKNIPMYMSGSNTYPSSGVQPAPGLIIAVDNPCGPVKKFAIYAAYAPGPNQLTMDSLVKTTYAALGGPPDPTLYAGYFCIDSSGSTTSRTNGWAPGYGGSWPDSFIMNTVTDGRCH